MSASRKVLLAAPVAILALIPGCITKSDISPRLRAGSAAEEVLCSRSGRPAELRGQFVSMVDDGRYMLRWVCPDGRSISDEAIARSIHGFVRSNFPEVSDERLPLEAQDWYWNPTQPARGESHGDIPNHLKWTFLTSTFVVVSVDPLVFVVVDRPMLRTNRTHISTGAGRPWEGTRFLLPHGIVYGRGIPTGPVGAPTMQIAVLCIPDLKMVRTVDLSGPGLCEIGELLVSWHPDDLAPTVPGVLFWVSARGAEPDPS